MPLISVVMPCYNEEENIVKVSQEVKELFERLPHYEYEHIFIDNGSTDRTIELLRSVASSDPHVKVIINARNFGHIRSPYHAIFQAKGDAVITAASDFQDPISLMADFLQKWEEGYKIVIGIKDKSRESALMFFVRKTYYHLIGRLSEIDQIKGFTGFGLYDRKIIDIIRQFDDPYPYFRGQIAEIGFERAEITFTQPARQRGITKNNFYTLYDIAMLGITNHSKVPLRLATMVGFSVSLLSLVVAFCYFIAKLVLWNTFSMGMAPLIIGLFFFSSVQLFFIGIIGEYIGSIHTQVMKRPLVVEKERINFDE
jgi:polyisoprenyl-phosphate glycosyltransferase